MSNTKHTGLIRRNPSLMALEQRFMFDGAAVDTALDAFKPMADLLHFDVADSALPQAVLTARTDAQVLINAYLSQPDARTNLFAIFNGGQTTPSAQWNAAFDQLIANLQTGSDAVRVELRTSAELQGAKGAFAVAGTTGEYTIYLNSDWLAGNADAGVGAADSASIETVLLEELGHSLDARFNGSTDTAGDEGQHFSDVLLRGFDPYATDLSATADDRGTLQIDGQAVEAEFASFTFVNAYEMVYDLNNNSTQDTTAPNNTVYTGVDVNERWSDKEQNLHYFNATTSLGQVQVLDGSNGQQFSGNDVSATSIVIGGQTYHGWISRPIKANGVVRGFYFWTDANFSDLATAQADGNQDGDSNVTDNRGFLLVVDQAWFTSQINSTGVMYDGLSTNPEPINNIKDGNLGSIKVANVGSSSDRVDTALNSLLTQSPASAVDDTTST